MANNTNILQTIPLEGEVCLNRLDSEIRQFQGFREMNSPLNGDVLTPYHKKEQITDKTLAFDDDGNSYELQNGVLFKNNEKIEPEIKLNGSFKEELFDVGSPIVSANIDFGFKYIYCENWYFYDTPLGVQKTILPVDEKIIAADKNIFAVQNTTTKELSLRYLDVRSRVPSVTTFPLTLGNFKELCIFSTFFERGDFVYIQCARKGLRKPDGKKNIENFVVDISSKPVFYNGLKYNITDGDKILFLSKFDNSATNRAMFIPEKKMSKYPYAFDILSLETFDKDTKTVNINDFFSSQGLKSSFSTPFTENGTEYNNPSFFISDDLFYKMLPMRDKDNGGDFIGENYFYSETSPKTEGGSFVVYNTGYKVYGDNPNEDIIAPYWTSNGYDGTIYRDGNLIGAAYLDEKNNPFLVYDFYSVKKKIGKNLFVLNNTPNILRKVTKIDAIEENVYSDRIFSSSYYCYNIKTGLREEVNSFRCASGGCYFGINIPAFFGGEFCVEKTEYSKKTNQRQWKLFTSSLNPFFGINDPFFGVQYNPQLIYGNFFTPETKKVDAAGIEEAWFSGKGESVFYSDPDDKKGGSFVALYKKINTTSNLYSSDFIIDPPSDLAGLPFPQSSVAGLLLPLSYFAIKNIKKTFTGRDYLFDDNKAFELKYSGTTQFFGYDLLAGIDQVEDVFFLQGQPYCISNNAIFSFSVFNSQLQNISPIVSIYGLDYVANNGIIALFFSKFNRTFYAFNGSNQLILVKEANEIEDVLKSDYNTATKDIVFLAKNELGKGGVWVLRDNMSMHNFRENEIIDDFRLTTKDIVTTQKKIIEGVEKTCYTLYSLFDEEPTREPIHLKTNFYGSSENRLSKFDCFYFWLYKEKITVDGLLKVKIETITNLTKQTFEKVFNIKQSDFDQDGKMLVKWAPQYQSAVGCSLEVNSDFPIYSIQVSVTDQGVNTLTRFNG